MKHYTVKYKFANKWFFHTIKRVTADLKLDGSTKNERGEASPWPFPVRVFICEDGTRHEIPLPGTVFIFSPEREVIIKSMIEKAAGQPVAFSR